jgi:hypothetical protein
VGKRDRRGAPGLPPSLPSAHRPFAKVALLKLLHREQPEFFRQFRVLARQVGDSRFGANPVIGALLERYHIDTPWMRLLAARAVRELRSGCSAAKTHELMVRLIAEPDGSPLPPRPGLDESKEAYLRRAAEYFDVLTGLRPTSRPRKPLDYEQFARWHFRLARGSSPTRLAKQAGLSVRAFKERMRRFSALVNLWALPRSKRGRPAGRHESSRRRRETGVAKARQRS